MVLKFVANDRFKKKKISHVGTSIAFLYLVLKSHRNPLADDCGKFRFGPRMLKFQLFHGRSRMF